MIKEKRVAKGLSQQRLGELLGLSGTGAQVLVSMWESGKRKIPRKKIRELAKILGIKSDELI